MSKLKAAQGRRNKLLNQLFKDEYGIDDPDELTSLLRAGVDSLRTALDAQGLIAKSYEPQRPMRQPVQRQIAATAEDLLAMQPPKQPAASKPSSTVSQFDPAIHDAAFGDMLVPKQKAAQQLPASSPIYDNAYPGMRVLKEKPKKPDTTKYDPMFPGMKVPLK